MELTIDCTAQPHVPYDDWSVVTHDTTLGNFPWKHDHIELQLHSGQEDRYPAGNDIASDLQALPVLNANVLDYLLTHLDLIPEDWADDNGIFICFWGTTYTDIHGHEYVRCLAWYGEDGWRGEHLNLSNTFSSRYPAITASASYLMAS